MASAGPVSRSAAGIALLAVVATVASACGSEPTVAVGADVERPSTPSMATVRLVDVAPEVGLDFRHGAFRWGTSGDPNAMMAGGVCWIDYDRDGWLDLFYVDTWSNGEWGRWRREGELPSSRLFRNEAGLFTDVTEETGAGVATRGNGCVAADLDLDGWTDVYVTTERDNVLLWNDGGDGFIDDATLDRPSGAAAYGWHAGASVGDIDGNGWPDLFVAGYADLNRRRPSTSKGFPNTVEPEPDLLFLNDGPLEGARVAFRDVAADVGLQPDGADYGLGAVLTDLDRDGDLDLYVANDTTPNDLYEHVVTDDGIGLRFVERGVPAGVGDDGAGMGVASADFDLDGRTDLVVTNQVHERHVVFRQVGPFEFEDALASMGVPEYGVGYTGWGVVWADLDLDTDLDLVTAHGAIPVTDLDADREQLLMLENRTADGGDGEFVVAGPLVELDEVEPLIARGLASADFDNDGDVDLAIGTIGGEAVLLRNGGAGGNWLIVAPESPAPGAVVTVELPDGRRFARELQAGGSYLSSNDPRAHFGLGSVDRVERLTVERAGRVLTDLRDVEANRIVTVDLTER
jgi:hypothetical protein